MNLHQTDKLQLDIFFNIELQPQILCLFWCWKIFFIIFERLLNWIYIQLRETQRASSSNVVLSSPCNSPKGSLDRFTEGPRERERNSQELNNLRGHKKRLEEILGVAQEAERKRLEEIRQLKEVHETEMKDVKKIAKTEILKLVSSKIWGLGLSLAF